jgi:hypothetical protein
MRRYLVVFAVAGLMVSAFAPTVTAIGPSRSWSAPSNPSGAGITIKSTFNAPKSSSGKLAQSDQDLLKRTDSQVVSVMVKVDVDSVASYQGGIDNLAPTSPSVTGTPLRENAAAVSAYTTYATLQVQGARRLARQAVPSIQLGQTYVAAYGGFEARLPANKAKNLLNLPGIAAVQLDAVQQPLVDYSAHYIGADAVWPSLGGSVHAGQGTILANIDTGIWPEHPMLADDGIPYPGGGPYACEFGLSGEIGDDSFTCNDKMLGAYAFLQTNLAVTGPGLPGEFCVDVDHCSARDADGHGTHTSTTAAGDLVSSAVTLGVERGPVSGMAPGASVIEYRVCDTDGCFDSDSVAAVQQAILDGVDVISFSISGGANAYSDPVELAFLDAYAAGISVNAAAGNAGPGAATSDHAGPWTNTIGASTWDKSFASTLHLTADNNDTLDIPGVTLTAGITTPTPVVLASDAPYSDEYCLNPADPDTFTDEVVVCHRGTNARIEKGYNVLQGGAAGFVLYNTGATTDLESDSHFLPAIHVNDQAESIVAFVTSHTGVMATWAAGTLAPALGDEMASFSSRGPVGDFIKPDVTAPGVQILAGDSPDHLFDPGAGLGPNGEYYQAIAGTSMSTPHAAGTALLIKASHPNWTPGQIKSAEMTSAVHDVVKEDGSTPADPFDDGAGALRANRAVRPTVTFDVNPVDYYAAASDPLDRINLNLPSINAPDMQGMVTTTRSATNVTNRAQTLILSATGPGVSVSPHRLYIPAGATRSFTVTIDAGRLADGQYFGSIKLNPRAAGYLNAVLPVAFNKQPSSDISFSNECDTTTLSLGDSATCEVSATNYTPDTAHVSLQVNAWRNGVAQIQNYSPASKHYNGFVMNATLDPALPPPVLGLYNPADDGLVDLSGVPALQIPGFGDETIVNLSLGHAVRFGDYTYSTVGLTSNGYLVLDGGDQADVAYTPQDMPDSARPNGVIAPYWTDFNLSDGGGVYAAYFTCDGTPCAYEFEWYDVPIWGTDDSSTRTFAVWMFMDDFLTSQDYPYDWNEMVYGEGSAIPGDAGTPMNVGAEDVLGLTGAQLGVDDTGTTAPAADGYYVITDFSTPGGTASIDYNVFAKGLGKSKVTATMISDVTIGTAKIVTPFRVHH